MDIKISKERALPTKAVTSKLAFIGQSGSGKTYAAGKYAEDCLDIGAQTIIIDNVGIWWGLRLAADGKKPGISIPVFGGDKADVPLEPTSGSFMAKLIAENSNLSCVIDVSDFTEGEKHRWVEEFAGELLFQKKRNKSAVMLIWEEAHEFVPQFAQKNELKMLGAMQRLIKKGRNYGIGTTLISQQPQSVSKSVLNQTEILFAFKANGKHERKAVEEWVVYNKVEDAVKDAVADLPGLQPGECYLWSPSLLQTFEKVHIKKKWTFDASATPEFDEGAVKTGKLAKVDLETISEEMKALVDKAKEEDPEYLKDRIASLEKELEMARKQTKTKEVPVLTDKALNRLEKMVSKSLDKLNPLQDLMTNVLRQITSARVPNVALATAAPLRVVGRPSNATGQVQPKNFFLNERHELPRKPVKPVQNGERKLVGVAVEMLRILGLYNPAALSRHELAVRSVITQSGTFSNYISDLRAAGCVDDRGDGKLGVTPRGLEILRGMFPQGIGKKPTLEELVQRWKEKHLVGKANDMIDILAFELMGSEISRDDLAARVMPGGEKSGTFSNYLSDLSSAGLIEKTGRSMVRATYALISP
jgi:hypothetical protein